MHCHNSAGALFLFTPRPPPIGPPPAHAAVSSQPHPAIMPRPYTWRHCWHLLSNFIRFSTLLVISATRHMCPRIAVPVYAPRLAVAVEPSKKSTQFGPCFRCFQPCAKKRFPSRNWNLSILSAEKLSSLLNFPACDPSDDVRPTSLLSLGFPIPHTHACALASSHALHSSDAHICASRSAVTSVAEKLYISSTFYSEQSSSQPTRVQLLDSTCMDSPPRCLETVSFIVTESTAAHSTNSSPPAPPGAFQFELKFTALHAWHRCASALQHPPSPCAPLVEINTLHIITALLNGYITATYVFAIQ